MGLFDKHPRPVKGATPSPEPQAAPVASGSDLGQKTGKINLTKGQKVTLTKTPVILAKASWASSTDYDLYALVLLRDGTELIVSTFGSEAQRNPTDSILNGAVRHLGDVGRDTGGQAQETIEIRLNDQIEAIVPVAYSAQSNGTGSFKRYKVSLGVDNGAGDSVEIDARNANNNETIYSVAIAIIRNTPAGVVIEHLEDYSSPGSENRPTFRKGQLVMDAGSKNLYK